MTSSLGFPLSVRVVRANGVNTAVAIFDAQGRSLVPLVVQYPIEKGGVFREMAYYTSAHPALSSPDLSRAGRAYIHRMISLAVQRLRERARSSRRKSWMWLNGFVWLSMSIMIAFDLRTGWRCLMRFIRCTL